MDASAAAAPIAIVTDTSACLPAEVVAQRALRVVPLQVVIGAESFDEGSEGATPEVVAEALRAFRPVSTSPPSGPNDGSRLRHGRCRGSAAAA